MSDEEFLGYDIQCDRCGAITLATKAQPSNQSGEGEDWGYCIKAIPNDTISTDPKVINEHSCGGVLRQMAE